MVARPHRGGSGCWLIGSGPSLNEVDVTRVGGDPTIAFNRSYVAWVDWGFAPDLHAWLDTTTFADHAGDVADVVATHTDTQFFLPAVHRSPRLEHANVTWVDIVEGTKFSGDIARLTDFGNVGCTSLQILHLLGFKRVVLIGVDARYVPIPEDAFVRADGFVRLRVDPNHFSADYLRSRRGLQPADLERVLGRWPAAAAECGRWGVDVRNASPGSALDCFQHIAFEEARHWLAAA